MMTPEQIKEEIEKIDAMTHEEMCRLWRFAPIGHKYFDSRNKEVADHFQLRLFKHFGGFTPEISKRIGWR